MLISSFYGDAFAGQFALRLKGSAKHFDIECDLFKWADGASEADRSRLRSKLIARNLAEHPADDILFVEPDACFQRRPDILLDEKDYDVGVYYDLTTLEVRRLPVTYAWVERLHRDVHPAANPVIVHFKTDGLLSSRIRIPR